MKIVYYKYLLLTTINVGSSLSSETGKCREAKVATGRISVGKCRDRQMY